MTRLSQNLHYAPKSSKAGLWHGLTSAGLRSACGSWAIEGQGTLVDHPSSPGCRISTDHKCPIRRPQILGSHTCTPGWPHWVWMIRLCLPLLRKVTDHGVSSDPAQKAFCDLLAPPGIKVCVQMLGLLPGLVTEGLISWLLFLGR